MTGMTGNVAGMSRCGCNDGQGYGWLGWLRMNKDDSENWDDYEWQQMTGRTGMTKDNWKARDNWDEKRWLGWLGKNGMTGITRDGWDDWYD